MGRCTTEEHATVLIADETANHGLRQNDIEIDMTKYEHEAEALLHTSAGWKGKASYLEILTHAGPRLWPCME
jgi:hypothetical protein